MTRAARVTVRGFRDLDRRLSRLATGVPETQQRAILHEGARLIVEEAKRLAPVDTGNLRDSIASTDDRDARVYGKLNFGGAPSREGIAVYIGPVGSTEDGDVFYARFQEFGWRDDPGSPFMRPALAAKREDADRLVARRLGEAVYDLAR